MTSLPSALDWLWSLFRHTQAVLELLPTTHPLSLVSYSILWSVSEPGTTWAGILYLLSFITHDLQVISLLLAQSYYPRGLWSSFGGNLLLGSSCKMTMVTICICTPTPDTYILSLLPHLEHHKPTFSFYETVTWRGKVIYNRPASGQGTGTRAQGSSLSV